jgi:hypothetical protein
MPQATPASSGQHKVIAGPVAGSPSSAPPGAHWLRQTITLVGLAILLGCAIEAVLLAVGAILGPLLGAKALIADLFQMVSWSLVMCLAIGVAASKVRPSLTGLLSFCAAPVALLVATAAHQGASQVLGIGPVGSQPQAVAEVALRAMQFGILGLLLGRLSKSATAGLLAHAGTGLAAGLLFVLPLVFLSARAGLEGTALFEKAIQEIVLPLGCALVVYASDGLNQPVDGV